MSLDHLRCDLRLAWRGLTRAKAFSAAAIVTLALGIAGTTVMFTLVRGVLLRPLPVRDQEQLIVAWKELRSTGYTHHPFGGREIEAVGRENQLFEIVAGADGNGAGRIVVTEDGVSIACAVSGALPALRARAHRSNRDAAGRTEQCPSITCAVTCVWPGGVSRGRKRSAPRPS